MEIIIEGGTVLTMGQEGAIREGAVVIEDDRIIAVGSTRELKPKFRRYERFDARSCIIMPGLINAHQHISMGLLSQKGRERMLVDNWRYRDRDLVLVDESQNFRHRDTQRYAALQLFTQTRPTILLTATPRATSAWDIYHQIKLWHPQDTTAIPINPPNLSEFFHKVEPRNQEPPSRDLQEILNHILIRRTRRHIRTYYPDARINGQPLVFPDRKLETITYSIEDTYRGPDDTAGESRVYKRLHDLMGRLTYARYALFDYVRPEHQNEPKYQELQRAGAALRGLMRVMLFKRFESSVHAFRETVNRLRDLQRAFQGCLLYTSPSPRD